MSEPRVRANDGDGSPEYKKRQIPIHAEDPQVAVKGMLGKARVISLIIKDLGTGTVVTLFFMGLNAGWIPSPLVDLQRNEAAQTRAMKTLVTVFKAPRKSSAKNRTDFDNCDTIHTLSE